MKDAEHDLDTVQGRNAFLNAGFDVEAFHEACERALSTSPDDLGVQLQHAQSLGLKGRVEEKIARLRKILAANPKAPAPALNLGLELLADGFYRDGWPHYHQRFRMKNVHIPDPGLPAEARWKGQPLAGKRICLIREQGLGDTLQFVRYAVKLREFGAITYVNPQPALRDLLAGSPAVGKVLYDKERADLHHWIHVVDLVPVFSPTRDDIHWPGAYVSPPATPAPVDLPTRAGARLSVGLAWTGNPRYPGNAFRSVPLEALAPLREASHCAFYGLLPAPAGAALKEAGFDGWITDLSSATAPFTELARVVASMDLIVTVCTSVAHLSAAMGKPTLLMLSASPDWRWGRTGDSTPWYPSMSLYRQSRLGVWEDVVKRVRDALCRY